MTMSTTLITSRDPKGLQATSIFEAAYNQAKLDDPRAQRLNENGGELKAGILKLIADLSVSDRFAGEEVSSSYTYPKEYKGPKPIQEQIKSIATLFDLDPSHAYEFATSLPQLPEGAEGWFAVPSIEAVAKKHFPEITNSAEQYCQVQLLILKMLGDSRSFYNYRDGEINSQSLRMHARTAHALDLIKEVQKGDILIVAGQLGMRHRGRSVRRAREFIVGNQYGFDGIIGGSIALTHPERFVRWEELDMDCPGAEFKPGGGLEFSRAPIFIFSGDGLGFGASAGPTVRAAAAALLPVSFRSDSCCLSPCIFCILDPWARKNFGVIHLLDNPDFFFKSSQTRFNDSE